MQPRLTEQNEENLRRLSVVANVSANALANYLISRGTKILEEFFNNTADKKLKESFLEAIKTNQQKRKD